MKVIKDWHSFHDGKDLYQHRHTLNITGFVVYFNGVPALTHLILYSTETHEIYL